MVHFASFSFARLLQLCVFWAVFLRFFPPISSHSSPLCLPETPPFPFITQHFGAFSLAFSRKKHGILPHLAHLFHAKSTAFCGT